MQQPQDEKSRLRGPILFLLISFIIIAVILLAASLNKPQNNYDQPVINLSPTPTVGSFSENVQSIQINEVIFNAVPEINIGGTLTGVLICLASFAIFMIHKKRSSQTNTQ
jgi:hypothetical protein